MTLCARCAHQYIMSVEKERLASMPTSKQATSPVPVAATEATKDEEQQEAQQEAQAQDPMDQQYYLGKTAPGTGLKTNLLLTSDTIPPDIYGQPRRLVPTVPSLRPDFVSSTIPNVAYAVVEGAPQNHGAAPRPSPPTTTLTVFFGGRRPGPPPAEGPLRQQPQPHAGTHPIHHSAQPNTPPKGYLHTVCIYTAVRIDIPLLLNGNLPVVAFLRACICGWI
jgi:hypothetical protein